MKRKRCLAVVLLTLFLLPGCKSRIVPGTEETHYGVVVDRAMDRISHRDWHWESRAYIGIEFEDGQGAVFWFPRGESGSTVSVGDYVRIESGIEERTGLQIVLEVTLAAKPEGRQGQ